MGLQHCVAERPLRGCLENSWRRMEPMTSSSALHIISRSALLPLPAVAHATVRACTHVQPHNAEYCKGVTVRASTKSPVSSWKLTPPNLTAAFCVPHLPLVSRAQKKWGTSTQKSIVALVASEECVLACDVGTGGTKVALVERSGLVLASGFAAHTTTSSRSQRDGMAVVEQDSSEWWQATQEAAQACLRKVDAAVAKFDPSMIKAVSVTGQMQDVVPLPKDPSQPPPPAILYSDTRAHREADEVNDLCGGREQLAAMTGSAQGAASILAKLRWLDRHEASYFANSHSVLLGGHDYVVHQMCGALVTDATTASTTGLTLIDAPGDYAEGVLETLGLSRWRDKLPEIHAADSPCGVLSSDAAETLGVAGLAGIPVFHSCGDAGASTLGCGAGLPGVQYVYLGSSGWVAGSFPRGAQPSKRHHTPGVFTLAHPDPGLVFKTGSIMTAGGNLKWAKQALGGDSSGQKGSGLQCVDDLASSVSPGAGGVLYLPYLNGERCPFEDGDARAAFIGLSASTKQAHLYRAVLEGTAFAFRSARDALAADSRPVEGRAGGMAPLRMVGGGARSPVWPLIMAGVFGQNVETIRDAQEVGVKGAAILAGRWLGWHDTLSPGGDWLRIEQRFTPELSDIRVYEKLYALYDGLYPALRNTFQKLAAVR